MSNEIKIDTKGENLKEFIKKFAPDGYFFMKCKCGIFVTDYPFVAECSICGYIGCGNAEALEKAEKEGILIKFIEPKEIPIEEREKLVSDYEKAFEFNEFDNWEEDNSDNWEEDEFDNWDDDY